MFSHRKCVLIQEVCSHTGRMYSYKKYVHTQEICTHTGSMHLHRKYVLTVDVQTCNNVYILVFGVGVGFFLEAQGHNTLEVEGTGSDTGET